jgi:AcrR family transcriptional regulator
MPNADKMKNIRLLKENEFRNDVRKNREEFMLGKAREILNKNGFQALNLPELAKLSGYSKPTIYKYFSTKEDLMVALANQSTGKQIAYLERALTFEGRPREILHGIQSLNSGVLFESVRDAVLIHTDKIRSLAAPERRKLLDTYEERRIEIIAQIIREAVAVGDLVLPYRTNEYELQIAIMSTQMGALVLQESDSPVVGKWFKKINFSHGMFGRIILDGLGWRPLTSEWRYSETVKRFYQEVFPEFAIDEKGNSIKAI